MAEEIFAEEIISEKPVARGREIPPGRTVPDQSPDAFLNTQSMPVGPEEVDNLPDPTPEEENQIDIFLGNLKDFIWDEGYNSIVGKLQKGQDKLPETIGNVAIPGIFSPRLDQLIAISPSRLRCNLYSHLSCRFLFRITSF